MEERTDLEVLGGDVGREGVKLLVVLGILIIVTAACRAYVLSAAVPSLSRPSLPRACSPRPPPPRNADSRCSLTRMRWGTFLIPLSQMAAFNAASIRTFLVPICC